MSDDVIDNDTRSDDALSSIHASRQSGLQLPQLPDGQTLSVEGTNVVRVPFGVRRPRRNRPARPDHWATLVLPFQAGGSSPTPPPQAA